MAVLVVADHTNTALGEATAKTVAAAQKLSPDIDILVAGENAQAAADAAAKLEGVRKVLVAESPALGHQLAEAVTDAVVALADGYDAILIPATSAGKNYAPRIAAKLDVNQITDVIEVVSAGHLRAPDLRRQCARDCAVLRRQEGHHHPPDRLQAGG